MLTTKSKNKLRLLLSTALIGGYLSTQCLFAAEPATGRREQADPTVPGVSLAEMTPGVTLSQEEKIRLEEICREITDTHSWINEVEGQEIIVLLGRTGSGKSTSVDYLDPRIRLVARGSQIILDPAHGEQQNALSIGSSRRQSETLYPKCHQMEDGSYFVDLPGFMDTRGPDLNLITAAFIKKILESAVRVKFVFVMGADQLSSRESTANETFNQIKHIYEQNLYQKMIERHSIFLVTKSSEDTAQDIENIRRDDPEHPLCWYDPTKICCIPKPSSGLIDISSREGILEKIRQCAFSEEHTREGTVRVNEIVPHDAQDIVIKFFQFSMQKIQNQKLRPLQITDSLTLEELYGLVDKYGRFVDEWKQAFEASPVVRILRPFVVDSGNHERNLMIFQRGLTELVTAEKTRATEMRDKKHKELFDNILAAAKDTVLNAEKRELGLDDTRDLTPYSDTKIQQMITNLNNWQPLAFKAKLKQTIEKAAGEHQDMRAATANEREAYEKTRQWREDMCAATAHDPVAHEKIDQWRYGFLGNDVRNSVGELTALLTERKGKLETEQGRRRAEAATRAAERQAVLDREAKLKAERDKAESDRKTAAAERQAALDREAKLKAERDKAESDRKAAAAGLKKEQEEKDKALAALKKAEEAEAQKKAEKKTQREKAYDLAKNEKSTVFDLASKSLISHEDSERITKSGSEEERQRLTESNRIMPEVKAARKELANYYNKQGNSYMAGEWEFSSSLAAPFCKDMASNNQVWERAPQKNVAGYDTYSRKQRDD